VDTELTPRLLPGIEKVVDMAVDVGALCAVRDGGRVLCAGNGLFERLGIEGKTWIEPYPGLPAAAQITFGREGLCLRTAGSVRCVKHKNGAATIRDVTTPASVRTITGDCAVLIDDTVACWGERFNPNEPLRAVRVGGLEQALLLDGNDGRYCASTKDHKQLCWGNRLIDRPNLEPRLVGNTDADAISVGQSQFCAHSISGWACTTLRHSLDLGLLENPLAAVPELTEASAFDATTTQLWVNASMLYIRGCAVAPDGAARCEQAWGEAESTWQAFPFGSVRKLASSGDFLCAVRRDGRLACLGRGVPIVGRKGSWTPLALALE
jgi:hypothetical protein